ncbi:YHS domain-containing protein [Marinomonas sp. C2222]|uniref:YHS domain-containing protein n=1 Tax=Marinomonas sargassi TaxID=2984494 RepID=A0ABT2YTQ1_9GAMM|nr:YHS domain-containing (seleno)protein [Marinomonas sargassi]MCV2403145.1 YHS domain-containing protein [Marinomonas sargassi]
MNFYNLIKSVTAAIVIFASASVLAADVDINANSKNVAIKGYDTVAYFTMEKPVKGSKEFTATYKGATYYFASAENRDLFNADKTKYLPQYGGFCAMGVAFGQKVNIDPKAWKIVDGKLYLNNSKSVQKRWLKDVPGNIQTAEQKWPTIQHLTAKEARAL